jgi:hypothetical protein
MFEWGGGYLWCGNDAARERFGVGPLESELALAPETLRRLEELSAWHDRALDWDDPPAPSPWTAQEREQFDVAAREALKRIRTELGPDFEVVYEPL